MEINHQTLSIDKIAVLIKSEEKISLSQQAKDAIIKCRKYLDSKIKEEGNLYYGINTGFGALCNVEISKNEIEALQENLVKSHACGVGDMVPEKIVKIMLLLKIQSLCYGHSGVALSTVERLVDFYNHNLLPVVYNTGSLGASGDLAPLAHLSLPLIGEGALLENGVEKPTQELLDKYGWKALKLQSKEGLALLNGTQFMSAYGVYLLIHSKELMRKLNLVASLSLDSFACRKDAFHALVHQIRPHQGQIEVAQEILDNLADSEIFQSTKKQVQDPYSFRCIPQVHGATKDVLKQVEQTFTTEINSVTDNPNVFPEEDLIISAGNFHGQPLALALDFLSIALAELGSISERRIYLLLAGKRDLPPFLAAKAGLHSGLMIPQYTAAALVSKNKQLCTPSSVDSIPSSNGQEDHVSMGANGATKALQVLENVEQIVAIEWLVASQAIYYRRPAKTASKLEGLLNEFSKKVPKLEADRVLYKDLQLSLVFFKEMH